MNKYQNGKIYCLKSRKSDKVYVGSTTRSLNTRLAYHFAHYVSFMEGEKNFISSIDILEEEDYYIELIENYPCENKKQLQRREGEYIKLYTEKYNCVNIHIAGRTPQEWRDDNKEKITERTNKWRENNKEKVIEGRRRYYNENKDKLLQRNKEYHEKNKDWILERNRKYFNENISGTDKRKKKCKKYYEKLRDKI